MDKKDEKKQNEGIKDPEEEKETEGLEKEDKEKKLLQEKLTETEDKYRRALADYQNLQRRTQEQRIEWAQSANKELLLRLLPVVDTLLLAGKHTQDQGIKISINQFLQVLEEAGVKRIETVGKQFDPQQMECVTTQEGQDGKVLEETRAGFMLYDTILRTAQVIVGKAHKD